MMIDRIKNYFSRDESNLPRVVIIVVLAIPYLLLFIVGDNNSEAAQKRMELEREFQAVAPLPQADDCHYSAYSKSTNALVICSYKTNLSYPEIKAHYDAELAKQGWVFYEGEPATDRGRDYDGSKAQYCKGEYRAVIDTWGRRAGYGWDYSFSMSWRVVPEQDAERLRTAGCR